MKEALGQHVVCNKEAIVELERAKTALEEQLKGKVHELAVTKDILTKATEDNRRELNEVIKKTEEREQIVQESIKQLKEMFEQELMKLREEVKLTKQELQNQMEINKRLLQCYDIPKVAPNDGTTDFERSSNKILTGFTIPPIKYNVNFFTSSTETVIFADLTVTNTTGIGNSFCSGFGGSDFGSNQSFAGAVKPLFVTKIDNDDNDVLKSFEPTAEFKLLSYGVTITSGEENDFQLFSNRAILYRFDETVNQWKERGVGNIKILQHKSTGRVRILMRNQILKVCCNHVIVKEMKLTPCDDKSFTWSTLGDLSDLTHGEARAEQFTVKFQCVDAATAFQGVFNNFVTQNTAYYLHNENKSVACGGNHKSTPSSFSAMATLLNALPSIAMLLLKVYQQSHCPLLTA